MSDVVVCSLNELNGRIVLASCFEIGECNLMKPTADQECRMPFNDHVKLVAVELSVGRPAQWLSRKT
jgi:hypothetical protein